MLVVHSYARHGQNKCCILTASGNVYYLVNKRFFVKLKIKDKVKYIGPIGFFEYFIVTENDKYYIINHTGFGINVTNNILFNLKDIAIDDITCCCTYGSTIIFRTRNRIIKYEYDKTNEDIFYNSEASVLIKTTRSDIKLIDYSDYNIALVTTDSDIIVINNYFPRNSVTFRMRGKISPINVCCMRDNIRFILDDGQVWDINKNSFVKFPDDAHIIKIAKNNGTFIYLDSCSRIYYQYDGSDINMIDIDVFAQNIFVTNEFLFVIYDCTRILALLIIRDDNKLIHDDIRVNLEIDTNIYSIDNTCDCLYIVDHNGCLHCANIETDNNNRYFIKAETLEKIITFEQDPIQVENVSMPMKSSRFF